MLDIVVNNMAYQGNPNNIDYGSLNPFNDQKYFHPYCPINYSDRTSTLNVTPLLLHSNCQCWMGDTVVALPDLNTENTELQSMITNWIQTTVYSLPVYLTSG